jgi:hypothetical protein
MGAAGRSARLAVFPVCGWVDITTIIVRWIRKLKDLNPSYVGFATTFSIAVGNAFLGWYLFARVAERPSAELLRYMAAIGATFLIAYAVECSAPMRERRRLSRRQKNWVGNVTGAGAAGMLGIIVALALAERAEVGHWTSLDALFLSFAAGSLILLGFLVVFLPTVAYEWSQLDPDGDESND